MNAQKVICEEEWVLSVKALRLMYNAFLRTVLLLLLLLLLDTDVKRYIFTNYDIY